MIKSRKAVIAGLIMVLAVLVFFFIRGIAPERLTKAQETTETADLTGPPTSETKTVTLFFVREDNGLLAREERTIPVSGSVSRDGEAILNELIKGSANGLASALPPETKVLQVFVTKDGTAYADFSKDLVTAHPSGSDAEADTVYAIVNTLAANFPSVKKVMILVDGEERETLNGHLTLDRAFFPNYSRVAKD